MLFMLLMFRFLVYLIFLFVSFYYFLYVSRDKNTGNSVLFCFLVLVLYFFPQEENTIFKKYKFKLSFSPQIIELESKATNTMDEL